MSKTKTFQTATGISDSVRSELKDTSPLVIDRALGAVKRDTGIVEPSSAEVKELQKIIFNMKFDYDTLLNYTVSLLTHEQHTLFAAKKKEIFG